MRVLEIGRINTYSHFWEEAHSLFFRRGVPGFCFIYCWFREVAKLSGAMRAAPIPEPSLGPQVGLCLWIPMLGI